ncbi:hypothetical protein, partial [Holdemania massiliensis]|uniref:hypothetical protein n=1 Tax=Holdemania massiliensis TaxID=1468449 RepID=UPI0019D51AFE
SLVLFVLPHYERVKSTRIRWKSDFHLPRPEVELNFSIELIHFSVENRGIGIDKRLRNVYNKTIYVERKK